MKKRILVVDDEWAILELLKFKLVREGYEVMTARNEREFWDQALSSNPDLVILDICLGSCIGTDSYQSLLEFGFNPKTPVIFISSLAGEGTVPKPVSKSTKFSLFGKPFQFKGFMLEVKRLLEETFAESEPNILHYDAENRIEAFHHENQKGGITMKLLKRITLLAIALSVYMIPSVVTFALTESSTFKEALESSTPVEEDVADLKDLKRKVAEQVDR